MISVFDTVENIVGKGENADYQHFLHFSHNVFKRLVLQTSKKQELVWKRVKFCLVVMSDTKHHFVPCRVY